MKTITFDQLAELSCNFIQSEETTAEACGVLAQVTEAIIPDEDRKEFMALVVEKAMKRILEGLKDDA